MDIRLEYMAQESRLQERFFRAVWNILTKQQQVELIAGDYDSFVKKNMGHQRAFSSDKQVRKAFGDPSGVDASTRVAETRRKKYAEGYVGYSRAAEVVRRAELAFDLIDRPLYHSAVSEMHRHFRTICMLDFDARRAIYQSGYDLSSRDPQADAVKAAKPLWKKAEKQYTHAVELLAMFPPVE
ncbi:hypothetical protein [Rubripirellula tenax]|nr:hypothetical protein [Rubripirellula tenax]